MEARTEQPSARKLQRARTLGQVAHSPDLSAGAALLAFCVAAAWGGERIALALRALLVAGLSAAAQPLSPADPLAPIAIPARELALSLVAPLGAVVLVAALAGFVQVGPLFAWSAIAPDFERLSPVERVRAWFAGERWLERAIAALKIAVVLAAVALLVAPSLSALFQLPLGTPARALAAGRVLLYEVPLRAGLVLIALGVADLVYRRARLARELRMTRRELQDEQRESYGVPEQRERLRRAREALRAQIASAGVEHASLLLSDGRGRALALAFDRDDVEQHAPRLLEKGEGTVAQRMQATADAHGVPVRLAPPLVAALYRLELTETIPAQHFAAVAELFAELPPAAPPSAP